MPLSEVTLQHPNPRRKMVIVGPPGCGKTALAARLTGAPFPEKYRATLGAVIRLWNPPGDGPAAMVWDLEGWHDQDAIDPAYLIGADVIVVMGDATEPDALGMIEAGKARCEQLQINGGFIFVLGKCDHEADEDTDPHAIMGYPLIRTSARLGAGLEALQKAMGTAVSAA